MDKVFTFSGQRQGEKVTYVVRNHPYILFWPGLKSVLAAILGIAVYVFWPGEFSGLFLIICLLVAFGIFFRSFYDFSQSVFLVTNIRVINVDQNGFWKRKITEAELRKVQDVASDMSGFARTVLKYGDLIIRTAGASEGTEIRVRNIPNPYNVQQVITGNRPLGSQ